MKKIILLFAFVLSTISIFAQDYSKLNDYKFKGKQDYKEKEAQVLECANYLFSNPVNKDEANRLSAIQFIMIWMEGTPDYLFSIDARGMELTKGKYSKDHGFAMYLAGMTKIVLENKGKKMTAEEVFIATRNLMADYCIDKNNALKPSKKLKKIMKERVK